jgi:hypothetical protein
MIPWRTYLDFLLGGGEAAPPKIVPCEPYLYEFLWRGRAPGDATPAAWHVGIETRLDAGAGHVMPHVRTLSVAQAIAEGWDLKTIGEAIAAEALVEIEQARAAVIEQAREIEQLQDDVQAGNSAVQNAARENATLRAAFDDRRQAADQLAIERDEHRALIRDLVLAADQQTAIIKVLHERLAAAELNAGPGQVRRGRPHARR